MQPINAKEEEKKVKKRKPKLIINLYSTKYKVVKDVALSLKFKIAKAEKDEWDLCWIDTGMTIDKLSKMKPYQKINHFPGMSAVARKNFLGKNLLRMKKLFPKDYTFFPTTYLLPQDWNEFKAQFANKKTKTFIVKPEALCQGQGIFLTRTYTDLIPSDHYVIQRYVHKPYLIDNLKFDLRIYALIFGCDPMRIYIYNEGLARFATEEYKGPLNSNLNNFYMHLTNYAINKNSENFIFNSDENSADVGHKRSLTSIWNSIDKNGGNSVEVRKNIESIIVKTMCSVQPTLHNIYRSCQNEGDGTRCFEVLGFDVLLDHNLKPWLLEVNHTPSFSTDTPFDYKVKFDLLSTTMRLLNMSSERRNNYKEALKVQSQNRIAKKLTIDALPKIQWKEDGFTENEVKYIGNYKLIYPSKEDDYDKYIIASKEMLEENAGTKKKQSREENTRLAKSPIIRRDPIARAKLKYQSPKPITTSAQPKNEESSIFSQSHLNRCSEPSFHEYDKELVQLDQFPSMNDYIYKINEKKVIKLAKLPAAFKGLLKEERLSESQSIAEKSIHKPDM